MISYQSCFQQKLSGLKYAVLEANACLSKRSKALPNGAKNVPSLYLHELTALLSENSQFLQSSVLHYP